MSPNLKTKGGGCYIGIFISQCLLVYVLRSSSSSTSTLSRIHIGTFPFIIGMSGDGNNKLHIGEIDVFSIRHLKKNKNIMREY